MTGTVGIKGKLNKLSTFTGNAWTKIQVRNLFQNCAMNEIEKQELTLNIKR